ncbi:MAG: ADP-ribosylglycohydrolase family protein [Paludibacteraceae bacterium]|nr:ADP-ribosylglycohydrolase family protein [Paludibacteraceae bacterium]
MTTIRQEKYTIEQIKSCLLGMAVGDALGVPFEFETRGTFRASGYHCDTQHGGIPRVSRWSGIPWGAWSDDTSMALASMDAIVEAKGKLNSELMMRKFIQWWDAGENCSIEETPFGLGGCIDKAMSNYLAGMPIENCGGRNESENGNGSLMRILPMAFCNFSDDEIRQASAVTHAHEQSTEACVICINIARDLMRGIPFDDAVKTASEKTKVVVYKTLYDLLFVKDEEVVSTGYVVDTLRTALWCIHHTASYREAVLAAVNFGYDTDTVACVTGGLAGIIYGVGGPCGIPQPWIDATLRIQFIEEKCRIFSHTLFESAK